MVALHLLWGAALAALALGSLAGTALAGGFAVREQSVEYQGMSFAGNAAGGGGLSGMFWNPAVLGEFEGFQTDSNYSLIAPYAEVTGGSYAGNVLFDNAPSGNMGVLALVPASYASYQLTDDLVAGVSMNAPFGLGNKTNYAWGGQTFNRKSEVATYNGQLALAYNVSPQFTVGGGLVLEYMTANLQSASGVIPTSLSLIMRGDDFGFGFTGGITWSPSEETSVGLGFRSAIKHKLGGDISIPNSTLLPAAELTPITVETTLPETLTLSVRHDLTETTRLLATAEWTNWSRLQNLAIVCSGPANLAFCPAGAGQTVRTLEFGWHDGYFFSAGLEHDISDALTVRGGLAYEISPVRAPDERSLRVPDADRYWLSLGASYQVTERVKANIAYSHVFFEEGAINRVESGIPYIGKSDAHLDIISVGMSVDY